MISKKSIRFYAVVVATILLTNYETMKAQVTIGADKLPETFSVLQLEGEYNTDKHGGLRMPRLTTSERNKLLTTPTDSVNAGGLAIYNTSKDSTPY